MHCHLAILATYYPIMAAQIIFSSTLASPSLPAVTGFYQPPMEYKTYGEGRDVPSNFLKANPEETAVAIVQYELGLHDGEVAYSSGYSTDTAKYAYLLQVHDDHPFINAVANLVLNNRGKIIALGSSFVHLESIASPSASVGVSDAIQIAAKTFGGSYNGEPVNLRYYALPDNSAALVYAVQIGKDGNPASREVYVDAHSGRVVGSTDYDVVEPRRNEPGFDID